MFSKLDFFAVNGRETGKTKNKFQFKLASFTSLKIFFKFIVIGQKEKEGNFKTPPKAKKLMEPAHQRYIRSIVRGVPQHRKLGYLFLRWRYANEVGNYMEAHYIRLYLLQRSEMLSIPRSVSAPLFNFNAQNEDQCLDMYRFGKNDII